MKKNCYHFLPNNESDNLPKNLIYFHILENLSTSVEFTYFS